MRLQTDPTVIYGLGSAFDGNLRLVDLRNDGPYNTYTRTGLPPTPISLPGRASLHAALHPDDGKALFFVSKGDGSHVFSETLEQHEAAVRRYQLRKSGARRSEEHTSELQSLMRISYAVFCLKKKIQNNRHQYNRKQRMK